MPPPAILTFEAAIPVTGSAIKVGGGAGEAVTLQLQCYAGNHINELADLRGKQLRVVVGEISAMAPLSEFIDHYVSDD